MHCSAQPKRHPIATIRSPFFLFWCLNARIFFVGPTEGHTFDVLKVKRRALSGTTNWRLEATKRSLFFF